MARIVSQFRSLSRSHHPLVVDSIGNSRLFSLSGAVEPHPSNTRPELPVTLVLAEDHYRFFPVRRPRHSIGQWHREFPKFFPHEYGIPFGGRTRFRPLSAPADTSLAVMLEELRTDLSRAPQVVLVARGPWYSWLAQCYLESHALAGLVLVDPIQMDDDAAGISRLLERHEEEKANIERRNKNPDAIPYEYSYLQRYLNEEKRTLLLEPNNVVPMLVLHSTDATRDNALHTAKRHNVEAVSSVKGSARQAIELIRDFIQESVI